MINRLFYLTKEYFISIILLIYYTIQDYYYDKKFNIKTTQFFYQEVQQQKNLLSPSSTPYRKIFQLINYLKPTSQDIFIDLGCGAGRVIYCFAQYKLKKVIGLDISEKMCIRSRFNITNYSNCIFIQQLNVLDYDFSDETIIYLYNPFDVYTLIKVLMKIEHSLITNPRQIRLASYNLTYQEVINHQDWLMIEKELGSMVIWRNKESKVKETETRRFPV